MSSKTAGAQQAAVLAAAPAAAIPTPAVPAKACGACPVGAKKAACPPAKFSDLNKRYKDLASDDFGFGSYKLTLKAKTAAGVNLKVEEAVRAADGSVSTLLEAKYTNAACGLTLKEVFDNKSVITTEVSQEVQQLKGLKLTAIKKCNHGAPFADGWTFKAEYQHAQFNTESNFSGNNLTSNVVVGHRKLAVGASATFDVQNQALKSHTVTVNYKFCPTTFNVSIADRSDVTASVHHNLKDNQVGTEVSYKIGSGENTFNLVGKAQLDANSFVKASLDKKLQFGLAYTTKVAQGVSLTLASQVNAAQLTTDSHKLGASLTFEA